MSHLQERGFAELKELEGRVRNPMRMKLAAVLTGVMIDQVRKSRQGEIVNGLAVLVQRNHQRINQIGEVLWKRGKDQCEPAVQSRQLAIQMVQRSQKGVVRRGNLELLDGGKAMLFRRIMWIIARWSRKKAIMGEISIAINCCLETIFNCGQAKILVGGG
jgi:hypothetical protein